MPHELGPESHELFERVTEAVKEVKEELSHDKSEQHKEHTWLNLIGLSTGLLAALAAIAAMQAGHLANEAMLTQIHAADQWNYFQSKSTKRHIAQSTVILLESLHQPVPAKTSSDIAKLRGEQDEIQAEAQKLEDESDLFLSQHTLFARSVTALQISISLGAVAALLRRKSVWFSSLGLAAVGVFFIGSGISAGLAPHAPQTAHASASADASTDISTDISTDASGAHSPQSTSAQSTSAH